MSPGGRATLEKESSGVERANHGKRGRGRRQPDGVFWARRALRVVSWRGGFGASGIESGVFQRECGRPYGHQWMLQHEIEKVSSEELQKRWDAMSAQCTGSS